MAFYRADAAPQEGFSTQNMLPVLQRKGRHVFARVPASPGKHANVHAIGLYLSKGAPAFGCAKSFQHAVTSVFHLPPGLALRWPTIMSAATSANEMMRTAPERA